MSIILGIIVPALLFLITLPLQSFLFLLRNSLKVIEIREKRKGKGSLGNKLGLSKGSDKLRSELGLSPKKNRNSMLAKVTSKMKIATLKTMQLAIRAISMLISLLRTVASTLITLVITAVMMMLPVCLAVIIATSGIVMFYNSDNSSSKYSNVVSSTNVNKNSSTSSMSADVNKMINMSDKQLWLLASGGRFKSYTEANNALKANKSKEEKFWNGLKSPLKVKVWVWKDSSKKKKKEVEHTFTVNKYLKDYWKAFLTDWHNLPDKYVLVDSGDFNVRTKNNNSGSGNYSSHSFGGALDFNWNASGMGSVVGVGGDYHPWNSDKGLSEPYKSECCAFNSNWHKLIKKYKLDWGGNWSEGSLDPMHISIIGDNSKDVRYYKPKTKGKSPN